jgi:hypothetical protein
LREPFKRELTERLLARRGERVSEDDIRTIAADFAARDANAMSDVIIAVIALIAVAFAITLGVLLTDWSPKAWPAPVEAISPNRALAEARPC